MVKRSLAIARADEGTNTIEHKGYVGKVEFDNDAGVLHGEVMNLRDVITFQGESVAELRQAFIDSVEDYLEFCAERGEEPEKPYSGKFVVRIDPKLHRDITICAKRASKSLNQWVSEVLEIAASDAVAEPVERQLYFRPADYDTTLQRFLDVYREPDINFRELYDNWSIFCTKYRPKEKSFQATEDAITEILESFLVRKEESDYQ